MSAFQTWPLLKSPYTIVLMALFACTPQHVLAQQPRQGPGGRLEATSDTGQQGQSASVRGAEGGAAQADFDTLIDLIQSTVEADTWMDAGTGEGEISPFDINGVYVDAAGSLSFNTEDRSGRLEAIRKTPESVGEQDVRIPSPRRYVSLPRLEAAILERQRQQLPLSEEMLVLAGLERIEAVVVTPETGDLLIVGPAGDWQVEHGVRIVSTETGTPIVRLDDLLTLWRRRLVSNPAAFGCSIIPRQEALAATQAYVQQSADRPIEPSQRGEWLETLRQTLGKQDVKFFGIEADSHVARVLLVADYHMKLIGMGIVDGVDGVRSYLSTVRLGSNGELPPMTVLRWWFSMNYDAVRTNQSRDVYRLEGPGVKVLSENELLAAQGRRVHTGESEELNRLFATSFTEHFGQLAVKYPLYGELRNVFDLAMVITLIDQEGLTERVAWQPTLFSDPQSLPLPPMRIPEDVDTVMNHRVINRRHIVAGISGGVWADAASALRVETGELNVASLSKATDEPPALDDEETEEIRWWWD